MNENIKNIAKIINSKCRFQNCNDCIKSEDTCWEFETAIALDEAGYRKQSKTVTEFAEKAINSLNKYCYIPRQVSFDAGFIEGIKQAQATLMELAEQYSKEVENLTNQC